MCVRFAIGMAEAGFFPSVLYHYAFWYKPVEMPQRIAFFYSVGQVSSALSGLLAYAISHMVSPHTVYAAPWILILPGPIRRSLWMALVVSSGGVARHLARIRCF